MGGRGASSGTYKLYGQELEYGDEYMSVLEYENIKFVVGTMKETEKTAPRETMTDGRIYVFVNKRDNMPASIVYFDGNGKRFKQIDLKDHDGMGWHVHSGYNHKGPHRKMSAAERRTARTAMAVWRIHMSL